ncbi:hypothetical protein ACLOJK_014769 [Asimina triloba]
MGLIQNSSKIKFPSPGPPHLATRIAGPAANRIRPRHRYRSPLCRRWPNLTSGWTHPRPNNNPSAFTQTQYARQHEHIRRLFHLIRSQPSVSECNTPTTACTENHRRSATTNPPRSQTPVSNIIQLHPYRLRLFFLHGINNNYREEKIASSLRQPDNLQKFKWKSSP